MLGVDFLVMIGALIFFFLRAASDADRREEITAHARHQNADVVPPCLAAR